MPLLSHPRSVAEYRFYFTAEARRDGLFGSNLVKG
jgi:hypothetical protein